MVDFLRKTGMYSEEELELLEAAIVTRDLRKGDVLLEVGIVCSESVF